MGMLTGRVKLFGELWRTSAQLCWRRWEGRVEWGEGRREKGEGRKEKGGWAGGKRPGQGGDVDEGELKVERG
jgi:hypothetical protein